MSIYFVIFLFLLTFCTRNLFQSEGKLLRVRLIMKNYRIFNFLFKKLINAGNIHKVLQEKKCMCNMSYFILMYLTSYLLCTRNYIHCDEKLVTFRLIFKYLRTFTIFIEDIKKYCKFSLI